MKNYLLNLLCCFKPQIPNEDTIYNIEKFQYKKFNLDNLKGKYYVKSVYDGDTVTILIPMSISQFQFNDLDNETGIKDNELEINLITDSNPNKKISFYEIRIRIYGIDTPEMKPSKNLLNRDEHIKKAHQAKDYLSNMILNKIIYCEFMQNDKYGRPLAKLYYQNKNISNIMIENGFAKSYDGGTKDTNF